MLAPRSPPAFGPRAVLVALAALILLGAAVPGRGAAAPPSDDAELARERDTLARFAKAPAEQHLRAAALDALGRIGGPEAAEAVAPALDDPFVHLRDRAVSAWIAMARGPRADASIAWLASIALADRRHASRRRDAAVALGVAGGPEATRALVEAARRETSPTVLLGIAEGLGRCGAAAREGLVALLGSRDAAVVGAAARAVGRLEATDDRGAAPLLLPLLSGGGVLARAGAVDGLSASAPLALADRALTLAADGAVEVRIALADALPALGTASAPRLVVDDTLAALLRDRSWRVRAAAIEAATGLWTKDAIPLLLDALGREHGRLRCDVLRALRTLSGVDPGDDAELWSAWWTTRGAGIDLGPRPAPDAYGHVRRRRPSSSGPGDLTTAASFFRLPIASKRVAFLFDFSGSMKDPVEGAASKADLARSELASALSGLGGDQAFDLFVYRYPSVFPPAPKLTRALGALTSAGGTSSRQATAWLAEQGPKGWGAFYDALVEVAEREDVDTIVLLSDGVPSRGRYDRGPRLVTEFVEANRFRRVAIDTVLVGADAAGRRLMQGLADATGGRFVEVSAGDPREAEGR